MATAKKATGRPSGEVQVGEGFDEMLKRLAELYKDKGWSFKAEGYGTIDDAMLSKMATEQEADQKADRNAWSAYQVVHEPVMKRQGARGAIYSSALNFARTSAKGNRDLLKILGELKIRTGGKRKKEEPAAK